jgi:hypothetical protein
MGQFSMKITPLPGSLLGGNQQPGDAGFDAAFHLRASPLEAAGLLSPAMRSAILALGEKGQAGRPFLVFLPGYLAVLFPTNLSNLAFHVPPYWVAIDADALLARFASDLAVKNSLLNAVLALPVGATTN